MAAQYSHHASVGTLLKLLSLDWKFHLSIVIKDGELIEVHQERLFPIWETKNGFFQITGYQSVPVKSAYRKEKQ